MNIFLVLIFLKALANVLFTPAVCLSEPVPLIKASAIALEVKQAVRRNIERFPDDFMFELTKEELENWRSQFVMPNPLNKMGLRYAPFAFSEQGVAMLSSILKSKKAIDVNIAIMRSFVMLRQHLTDYGDLKEQIAQLYKGSVTTCPL
ncbi:ORF6N domain-containing protein [Winogradskyella sp.]|uniref:ORF6N domain-containing protein n=1 Tax=Winogradskyella sp. TaxID=1883156 RepID=UPI00345D7265